MSLLFVWYTHSFPVHPHSHTLRPGSKDDDDDDYDDCVRGDGDGERGHGKGMERGMNSFLFPSPLLFSALFSLSLCTVPFRCFSLALLLLDRHSLTHTHAHAREEGDCESAKHTHTHTHELLICSGCSGVVRRKSPTQQSALTHTH